jgi:hypothetical protein
VLRADRPKPFPAKENPAGSDKGPAVFLPGADGDRKNMSFDIYFG